LLKNLVGIKAFELAGNRIVLTELVELLRDVGEGNGLVADLGYDVTGGLRRIGALGNEIKQHTERKHPNDDPEEDADPGLLILKSSSHSRCLLNE